MHLLLCPLMLGKLLTTSDNPRWKRRVVLKYFRSLETFCVVELLVELVPEEVVIGIVIVKQFESGDVPVALIAITA